jgi:hypothetical protein
MITLIDTSSLVVLARYYQPFDKDKVLYSYLEKEISEGRMIVLDKVAEEAKYTSKGIALSYLPFLLDKKLIYSSDTVIPKKRFFNLLDNNFVVPSEKKLLDDTKYEERRNNYLRSADAAIVIFADSYHGLEPIQIVTEESSSSNDRKLFKKIPLICGQLNIKTLSLPDYLKGCKEVEVVVKSVK